MNLALRGQRSPQRERRPLLRFTPELSPLTFALLALGPGVVLRGFLPTGLFNTEQFIAMTLAVCVLVLITPRPAPCVAALVWVLPFQLMLTAGLYEIGVPGGVARMAALWKELVVLGLVIAAWRRSRDHALEPDPLDIVAGLFVALGTGYLLIPELFVGDPGSSLNLDTRFTGWRLLVLPTVLVLAGRRLRPSASETRVVLRAVTGVSALVGSLAVVEFVASDTWNRLLIQTFGVNRYRSEVLELPFRPGAFEDIRTYGVVAGREIVRIGGPVVSYLTFSYVLLILLGVLLERLVRGNAGPRVVLGLGACGAGLLFTQTRSSIVGGCVMLVVVLRAAPGRSSASRIRYTLVAGAALAIAVPVVLGAGLADRFTSGDDYSEAVHDARVDHAYDTIREHPLGLGLAMGSTASGRPVEGSVTVENQILDTGVQLGVLGIALFVGQYALLIKALHRAAAQAGRTAQILALGLRNAMFGLLVPLWYQQAFGVVEVSWVLFALAGIALGAAEAGKEPAAS